MTQTHLAVIDDDADLRKAMCWMLRLDGFEVSDFADAREAISQIEAGLRVDVILLDLMMPDMNGWEFCKYRASSAALQEVPVIVITARRSIEAPAGASEILLKPFEPQVLNDAIARVLTPPDEATPKPGV
jgi:DNA-binding response OmpR family regulator